MIEMGEAISPQGSQKIPISRGQISVRVRINVDEERYPEGAISPDEINKILDEYVKPEYRDRIQIRQT